MPEITVTDEEARQFVIEYDTAFSEVVGNRKEAAMIALESFLTRLMQSITPAATSVEEEE